MQKVRSVQWCSGKLRFAAVVALCLISASVRAQGPDSVLIIRPHFATRTIRPPTILPHPDLKRPKVGLVFSGGGARGIAHIGVLKALVDQHVPFDFLAATSMGAVVSGLYAAGYSPSELESLATTVDWDYILALTDQIERRNLSLEKKLADDRSFLAVRFEGLEPVLPLAISSGQRLTDFLNRKIFQAVYQPYPDFDHMRISFRAVATDLISGKRITLRDGSLAEALRASSTVPLLFNPVEKGSMQLVDGGLVRNIPVDVAREEGCDITIVVNTTSALRSADEMKAPWQTADQIMGIMMAAPNEEQLRLADIVITPEIREHLSSDFHGLDTLIAAGERATMQAIPAIRAMVKRSVDRMADPGENLRAFTNCRVEHEQDQIPDSVWRMSGIAGRCDIVTALDIRRAVEALYAMGMFEEVYAEVRPLETPTRIVFHARPNPVLHSVDIVRCRLLKKDSLLAFLEPLLNKVLTHAHGDQALENIIREYRNRGYALARFDSIRFDANTGHLRLVMFEGELKAIEVDGGIRTQDAFVIREFSLKPGDVFELEKAQRGIDNLIGTTLFESVFLEVQLREAKPVLVIRLQERTSQLVRLGIRADNERHLQGLVDIRDENFRGTGTELGFSAALGERNSDVVLEYNARRLFDTDITFGARALHKVVDSYVFDNDPTAGENHWNRMVVGEYRDIRYGVGVSLGSFMERLGYASVELMFQKVQLVSLDNAQALEERHNLSMVRLGTIVDTKDLYPFPTKGVGLSLSYEFALQSLGSDVGYNALSIMYESYNTWANAITFHPKFTMGFADKTMPLSQQFRLGGRETFYGLREDDRRGRQLLLVNLEFRTILPVRLLFDTYLRARYDLGTISSVPEEIKFNTLLHGVGLELALATPVGPAVFGLGKSYYFRNAIPENPVQQGPLLLYFTIGYQL